MTKEKEWSALVPCALAVMVMASGAGCDAPTSPSRLERQVAAVNPVGPGRSVSGRVWLHDGGRVEPHPDAPLFGWVSSQTAGYTTGPIPVDGGGEYQVSIPEGMALSLYAGAYYSYQPCGVRAAAGAGPERRDVHVVRDRSRLGVNLPPDLPLAPPTLSGTVVEETAEGARVAVPGVRVELDGLFGMGLVVASTETDDAGRYLLCGLDAAASPYLFASKAGYRLFELDLGGRSAGTLDIVLER